MDHVVRNIRYIMIEMILLKVLILTIQVHQKSFVVTMGIFLDKRFMF